MRNERVRTFVPAVVPQRFRKQVGLPPFWLHVGRYLGRGTGKAATVAFRLLPATDDRRRRTIGRGAQETHFVTVPLRSLTTPMSASPPDFDAKGMAPIGLELCRLVPERISICIAFQGVGIVAPTVARDFGEPLARHADQVGRAMRRIVHRWEAVPPRRLSVFKPERFQSAMAIHGVTVIQCAELARLIKLPRRNRGLLPIACFGHHERQSGSFDRVD